MSSEPEPTPISGIVLAGGSSSRLGEDKAFIDVGGEPLVARVVGRLRAVVHDEIVLVTDHPARYAFLELPTTGDHYRGVGVLAGLHAGLCAVRTEHAIVVGCDMPFLNPALLRDLASRRHGYDVVMPQLGAYYEPLHAIYGRSCIPLIKRAIEDGHRRIRRALDGARVCYVPQDQIVRTDPELHSFFNVNRPADLARLRDLLAAVPRLEDS